MKVNANSLFFFGKVIDSEKWDQSTFGGYGYLLNSLAYNSNIVSSSNEFISRLLISNAISSHCLVDLTLLVHAHFVKSRRKFRCCEHQQFVSIFVWPIIQKSEIWNKFGCEGLYTE